jgi:DUF4097 and DUF4098 domain-containing protein YvlB
MASPGVPPVVRPYQMRRRSVAGPLVLIIIGVIFLLGNMHLIAWPNLGHIFARYWPLLLILWGGIRLAEYYSDRSRGYATRTVGGAGVLFLIFIIMIGMSASTADRLNWQGIRDHVEVNDEDFFGGMFGQNFAFTSTVTQDLPDTMKNGSLRVLSDRGDITVSAWDENRVKVDASKKVRAQNQDEANKIDGQTKPSISIDGNVITVNANTAQAGSSNVSSDLEIWVPRALAADIAAHRGDINVAGRAGNVKISSSRGDIVVDDITGNVDLEQRKGDIRVTKITGDVTVNAQAGETNISDINGAVKLDGEYFGGINLSKITKTVRFRTSRTDMELASLSGDLNMDGDELRANNLVGPMKVLTRSKEIHLDDLSGDLRVENSNGGVEVHSSKLGTIEIANRKGDVQIVVPEKSNFLADFKTHNGDINSDFSGLKVTSERNDSTATGNIGSGGAKIQISNEHGNIELRKAGQS